MNRKFAARLFLQSLAALFVIEFLLMFVLHLFFVPKGLSLLSESIIDSLSLAIFMAPLLYLFFYRPFLREISQHVQAQEALDNLKIGYGAIVSGAMDGFWVADGGGRILDVNDAYCRLIGYSRQELLGMSIKDVEASERPVDVAAHIDKLIELGGDRFETRHRCKDGRIVDVEVSVNYQKIDGGRLFAFLRDITGRKYEEKKLSELNSLNETLIKTIPFGMDIVDEDGNLLFLGPKFEALFGKDVIGRKCWELYRDDKTQCENCPLIKGIQIGETTHIETAGAFKGKIFRITHTGMVYQGKKAILEIFQDITSRKQMEEELIKANKELRELDRMRNEFINMASHELRTPIAIVKEGVSQLAEGMSGDIGQGQKRLAEISLRNINRLVRVVDNIFEISEIEFEKPAPKKEAVDIVGLVKEVTADFASQIREKGLEIRQDLPDGEVRLYAEEKALRRVLANLVSNAVKFTSKGFIEVKLLEKNGEIECGVSDSGIGIAPENLPKVFDKFQQFNRSFGPGERGTGLSLAIAKGIVELHKGKIWAESRLGEGSKFSFSLPK